MPVDCLRVFKLSSALSAEDEIKAWSIWRGYFFAMINQYSCDDFIFVSTLLAFDCSLYLSWPANLRINISARWISERRDDRYLSIVQESEATGRSEKI